MYENDDKFFSEINSETLKIMNNFISEKYNEDEVLKEAKWYLLKELAFAYCASDFFNSSVLTCYYMDFSLYRNILKNKYTGLEQESQHDILIYECRDEI